MRRWALTAGLTLLLPFLAAGPAHAAGVIDVSDSVAGLSLGIDVYGLTANTDYTIQVSGPTGDTMVLPLRTDGTGGASLALGSRDTEIAGRYEFDLRKDGSSAGATASAEIYPDGFDSRASQLTTTTAELNPDGSDEAIVTVTATDRFGNPLPDRPFALVSSRSDDRVDSLSTQTDDAGEQMFAVSTTRPGLIILRATDLISGQSVAMAAEIDAGGAYGGDTQVLSASLTGQVAGNRGSIIDHFEIQAPEQMQVGIEAQAFKIIAVDADGNVVPSYVNRVKFTSTDTLAELPGLDDTYKFQPKDQGQKEFALALKFTTPGTQTLSVSDVADPSIKGQKTIIVAGGSQSSSAKSIEIISPVEGSTVPGPQVVLHGRGPILSNLTATGGIALVRGATRQDGTFDLTVTLQPGPSATLKVCDETGAVCSRDLHLTVDGSAPGLGEILFTPASPSRGDEVSVFIPSDDTDGTAKGQVTPEKGGSTIELKLTAQTSGTKGFKGTFTPPAAGTYRVTASVTDSVGNSGSTAASLGVRPGKVDNVRAEPKGDLMEVSWDPVDDEVEGYRIYIGPKVNDWTFTLDTRQVTKKVTTKAGVRDLERGKMYAFAVSAVIGDLEGDLSDAITASTLGFQLDVIEQDSALTVQWKSLPQDIPVTSYVLRMGLKPDQLGEDRIIDVDPSKADGTSPYSQTLRDLINGRTYYLSLTPMAGSNPLLDLVARAEGTPNGNGSLTPGATFDGGQSSSVGLPPYIPPDESPLTPSGIPPWTWMGLALLALIAGALQWSHRRSKQDFLDHLQQQYRSR